MMNKKPMLKWSFLCLPLQYNGMKFHEKPNPKANMLFSFDIRHSIFVIRY